MRRIRQLLPGAADYSALPRSWRGDLVAGVTVGVVALPLALAFGVASGLGAAAGLLTAIVAGFLAAVFGGSHVQVSGPTGAMTVVLAPVAAEVGVSGVLLVTLMAGLVLVIAGIAKFGRYVRLLPWPLIEGFTLGIATIILLQQVPSALGVEPAGYENTALRALAAMADVASAQWQAVVIVVIVAAAMFLLPRLHRSAPASLIGIAAATFIGQLLDWPLAKIGDISASIPLPGIPAVEWSSVPGLVGATFSIAALAAIESLLSARVADGMADNEHHDPDRELVGQGVANVGSAMFGGMPATGAIARSAVNVRAGARTRLSAITHAALLLIVVLALSPLVSQIPLAALAAVLMVTAFHMIEFGTMRRIVQSTRGDAAVLIATAVATVAFDLVVAVELGFVLAALITLHSVASEARFERDDLSGVDIDVEKEHRLLDEHVVAYQLDGALFFGAAQRFLLELTEISDVRYVVLRLGKLRVLDATGARAIGDLVARLEHRGITVMLACVKPEHHRLINQISELEHLDNDHSIVPTIDDALDCIHGLSPAPTDRAVA